jgi:alkylation response protein AidB-like acyl-CoA dehydrogenase
MGMMSLPQEEQDLAALVPAVRIHGGYSPGFDAGRHFRGAPLMIASPGTNEIRRNVTVSPLIERGGL